MSIQLDKPPVQSTTQHDSLPSTDNGLDLSNGSNPAIPAIFSQTTTPPRDAQSMVHQPLTQRNLTTEESLTQENPISPDQARLQVTLDIIKTIDAQLAQCDAALGWLYEEERRVGMYHRLPLIPHIKAKLSQKMQLHMDKAKFQQEIISLTAPGSQQTLQSDYQKNLDECDSNFSLIKNYQELETLLSAQQQYPASSHPSASFGDQAITEELELDLITKKMELMNQLQTVNRFYGVALDSWPDLHPDTEWLPGGWNNRETQIMKNELEEFTKLDCPHLAQEETEHLKACSISLENAAQLELEQKEKPKETADKIRMQFEQLKDGEALLLLGGTKGHAIVYEVRRKGEDYIFTIINTGDDEIDYHQRNRQIDPTPRVNGLHKQYRYAHKAYQCTLSALDTELIEKILSNQSDKLKAAEHYQNIDKMMIQRNATPIHGRLHHQQAGNSCSLKSISSWLKGDLMIRFGEERGKALHAQFQIYRTKKRIEEMKIFERENPALARQVLNANSEEVFQLKTKIRDLTVQQVLMKREKKATQQ